MTLGDFLRAPRPTWDFVRHDCSRWLDAWLVAQGHASPMQAIGIEYSGPVSAARVIERGGGLLALWREGMRAIGLQPTDEPAQGDAAILTIPTDDATQQTTGIWTGTRWAACHRWGLMFGVGDPLEIWRV